MSIIKTIFPFSIGFTISAIGMTLIPILYIHYRSLQKKYYDNSKNQNILDEGLESSFYPGVVSHGRILPLTAKNSFSYSVLYMGLDLDLLESKLVNLPFNLFKFYGSPESGEGSTYTKLIGLRTKKYLYHGNQTFTEKIKRLLTETITNEKGEIISKYNIKESDIGKIWLLTMPSLYGYEGSNPLTTYYVYKKSQDPTKIGDLLCVILEVHNNFHESHAYVLKHDSGYRQPTTPGYDFSFKFPRTFHVSPFNSRDSYYKCDVVNPFPSNIIANYRNDPPKFKIMLKLLTSDDKIKFIASLTSGLSKPVKLTPDLKTVFNVLYLLFKWPATLLLVDARTFWQAYKLHYRGKLSVFPRPEHKQEGSSELFNPPEKDQYNIGSGLQRQPISWVEQKSRVLVEKWSKQRVNHTGIGLEVNFQYERENLLILPSHASEKDISHKLNGYSNGHAQSSKVVITTSDPLFFTNLLLSPSPEHSLILFKERLTEVSFKERFLEFFKPQTSKNTNDEIDNDIITRLSELRRTNYWLYLYSYSMYTPLPSIPPLKQKHFLNVGGILNLKDKLDLLRIIFWFTFQEYSEHYWFTLLNAKFVKGSEPWTVWERSLKLTYYNEQQQIDEKLEKERVLGSYQY
ncbi:uncharacterized protein L201_005997 [Kwoniella dendrophila CBS 6074]|uniref:Uncharacterized protein n=1 Tax=Kwoniella dendrophila CBS 6074 TaxID=1295534 RepID=A0AAX4K0H7_9TREE